MKKHYYVIALAAIVLVFAGCGGLTETGTPKDLIGVWSGSSSTGDSESLAGINEGTWKRTIIDEPTATYTITDENERVSTYYYNTDTVVAQETLVVDYDYSFSYSCVETTTRAARDAIAAVNTETAYTSGYEAMEAGTQTFTINITGTSVANSEGSYTTTVDVTESVVATGYFIGKTCYPECFYFNIDDVEMSDVLQTVKMNRVYQYEVPYVLYRWGGSSGMIMPKRAALPVSYDLSDSGWIKTEYAEKRQATSTDSYILTINEDGTGSLSKSIVVSQTLPAVGTTNLTITESGTIIGTDGNLGAGIITICATKYDMSKYGTEALISTEYPETAITDTYACDKATSYEYYISAGKLVLSDSNGEALVVLSLPAVE